MEIEPAVMVEKRPRESLTRHKADLLILRLNQNLTLRQPRSLSERHTHLVPPPLPETPSEPEVSNTHHC
ncbi:hypothetical protein GBAR_LOCUS10512 [Geodia barretti]|uniref:Uncharacterized protein n=1 Tax=Geodia barretti TaxID=519541 RepID=A0AA35WE84_GEOBA|nr:hypothetical protein GBAR_LOCUS10512 [Geodia barretti]